MLVAKRSDQFWQNILKGNPNECWRWTGTKNMKGYGHCQSNFMGTRLAHRIAWILVNGQIPQTSGKLCVCHHCDNPSCCNPSHLFLGTYKDNMVDAVRKNRMANNGGKRQGAGRPKGEAKVSVIVRLTVSTAAAIRVLIPAKKRSDWIEDQIKLGLNRLKA